MIDQAGLQLADACALVLDDLISEPEPRDALLVRVRREPRWEAISQPPEHTHPVLTDTQGF